MAILRSILDDAARKLTTVSDSPRLDAQLLLGHAFGLDHAGLIARLDEDRDLPDAFWTMMDRRLNSEPVAYILGEWEFYSMPLAIRPPTLVPRPETEHLVETVLELLPTPNARILEIGTGSGCIPMAIAGNAPNCSIVATDIKPYNLELASENIARHGLDDRVTLAQGSLFAPVSNPAQQFHVICSNPPYIGTKDLESLSPDILKHEDPDALFSGEDGLTLVREIISHALEHLLPGGYLILEIGAGQYGVVSVLLEEHGYDEICCRNDLAGIERIAIGRKPL